MADVRGACKRVFDGTTDGCQEFEADEFDPKLCDNCGCKKGFHEKLHAPSAALAAPAPACGPPAPHAPAPPAPPAQPVQVNAAEQETGLGNPEEQTAKKRKVTSSEGVGAGSSSGVGSASRAVAVDDEPALEQGGRRPPATLQRNYDKCLQKYPEETHGMYYLERKTNGQWGIMCEPCNQLLAVQSNHTLSNFERTHVDGAKHMGRLTAIREAARLEAEQATEKEEKLRKTRAGLVEKYAGQGELSFWMVEWAKGICLKFERQASALLSGGVPSSLYVVFSRPCKTCKAGAVCVIRRRGSAWNSAMKDARHQMFPRSVSVCLCQND
jgi:hypothetical protein